MSFFPPLNSLNNLLKTDISVLKSHFTEILDAYYTEAQRDAVSNFTSLSCDTTAALHYKVQHTVVHLLVAYLGPHSFCILTHQRVRGLLSFVTFINGGGINYHLNEFTC